MAEDFTLGGYRALMRTFMERGYAAVRYEDAEPSARHLILRHDIDMSVEAAVRLAEVEAAAGFAAHYFVLLGSELYNPWSAAGRDGLARIAKLGHRIGLHLDASLHPDDPAALEAGAATECRILESLFGAPVEVISFHRPTKSLQGRAGTLAGRRHAYEPRFFSEMGYCSDSRGAWHHGHPLVHPAVEAGRALQLLTHPIWWNETPCLPQDRLDRFLSDRMRSLDAALARECEAHVAGRAMVTIR